MKKTTEDKAPATADAAVAPAGAILSAPPVSDDLAAKPNPSSIMSAPRDPKKNTSLIIITVVSALLIGSIVLNCILFGLSAARNAEIERLEREVKDNQAVITDLKERLHEQ